MEISKEAHEKAREILRGPVFVDNECAVAEFIQSVSNAAKAAADQPSAYVRGTLAPFILPEPVDPLVDAIREMRDDSRDGIRNDEQLAQYFRAVLSRYGLTVVPKP